MFREIYDYFRLKLALLQMKYYLWRVSKKENILIIWHFEDDMHAQRILACTRKDKESPWEFRKPHIKYLRESFSSDEHIAHYYSDWPYIEKELNRRNITIIDMKEE